MKPKFPIRKRKKTDAEPLPKKTSNYRFAQLAEKHG